MLHRSAILPIFPAFTPPSPVTGCAMMDLNPFNWNTFAGRKLRACIYCRKYSSGCTLMPCPRFLPFRFYTLEHPFTSRFTPRRIMYLPLGSFYTLLWSLFYARKSLLPEGAGSYSWTDQRSVKISLMNCPVLVLPLNTSLSPSQSSLQ